MKRLKERVAIVTGAAQGIGAALARGMALEGARIAIADFQNRQHFIRKHASLFEERFAESNQRLEKSLQLDLRAHGYTGL